MYQNGQILKIKKDLYSEACRRSEEEFAQRTDTFHSIKVGYACRYDYHISDSFIQSVCGDDVVVLGNEMCPFRHRTCESNEATSGYAVCPELYNVKSLSSNQQILLLGWMLEDANYDASDSQELDEFLNSYGRHDKEG